MFKVLENFGGPFRVGHGICIGFVPNSAHQRITAQAFVFVVAEILALIDRA